MGYVWFGCGLALLIIILFFPVRLRLQFAYSKNAGNKKRLTVWLGTVRLAQNDFDGEKKTKDKSRNKKTDDDSKAFDSFMDKLRYYEALFDEIKEDLLRTSVYFKNRLFIPNFTLHLDLGFSDAAQTGMASGAAYALVYGVAALLYNNLDLKKKNLDVSVTPHYNEPKLDFYFNGIFRLRMVHIIKVLLFIVRIYNKYKNFANKTKEGGGLV